LLKPKNDIDIIHFTYVLGGGYSEGMPTFKTWVGLGGGIVLSLLAALAASCLI
jgi:hypothetical protein